MWACLVKLNANFKLNGSYLKTRSRRNFLFFDFLFKHSALEALKSPRTKVSTAVDFHQQQLELKKSSLKRQQQQKTSQHRSRNRNYWFQSFSETSTKLHFRVWLETKIFGGKQNSNRPARCWWIFWTNRECVGLRERTHMSILTNY